jgi:hypothetical protein
MGHLKVFKGVSFFRNSNDIWQMAEFMRKL